MNPDLSLNWNAEAFFRGLCDRNRLARALGMNFCLVSGLNGFEDALATLQDFTAFCCLADSSDGRISLSFSPNADSVKTVFLALRHEMSQDARLGALDQLREVFRQFLSAIIPEKTRLQNHAIYLADNIEFHEINEYFAAGCACAFFQIGINTAIDLRYNRDEWI